MTIVEISFLVLVLISFASFIGTLAFIDWWSNREATEAKVQQAARSTPPDGLRAH